MRVGRLVPEPGIAPRPHPDRAQLRQFLREVRLPLSAVQTMLELADVAGLPPGVELALRAAANQTDYLLDLLADYGEIDRLEADAVTARPERVELLRWLDSAMAARGDDVVAEDANPVRLQHRSFLPSHVEIDGPLVARALDAVLRVAVQRALPGPVQLRVAYAHERARPGAARLVLEVVTRGGGFNEIERGYLFTAFAVRDAAARPLLGLGIAQRLCTLLGGDLRVTSPGVSACSYQLSFEAPPSGDAHWVDPLAGVRSRLGPVQPGRVLFVGAEPSSRMLLAPGLVRAGHLVDGVESEEHVLGHVHGDIGAFCAIVFDPTCRDDTLGGLVDALRGAGFAGRVLRLAGSGGGAWMPFVDRVLTMPCTAAEVLLAITTK